MILASSWCLEVLKNIWRYEKNFKQEKLHKQATYITEHYSKAEINLLGQIVSW